jgi:hypothetical protein
MALLTLEGVYEDGRVELREQPQGVGRARVVVTFLPDEVAPAEATDAEAREAARQCAFTRMREGIDFGGERFNRAEVYEERLRELEARQDQSR